MKRAPFVAVVLAVIALATGAITRVTPTLAYGLEGCRMPSTIVRWIDTTSGTYPASASASAAAWTNSATPIVMNKVTSNYDVAVEANNYGNTGYDGITYFVGCSGGIWLTPVQANWNMYYTDGYPAAEKQDVMVHELGHALALKDVSPNPSGCTLVPIMDSYTSIRYNQCHLTVPQTDDVNGINHVY